MSKLSFRSRQLDVNKPIFIYRHEDYSKISEFAHGSRAVAPIPSGMEKEEESEFHIQQAIQNQKVTVKGIVIPTPSVETGDDYNLFYKGNFPLPKQLIHIQPFDLEENFPEYDLDTEDEEWLKQKIEHQNLEINPIIFENIINHLEKGSGQHMLTLVEAKLLMKDHPVYMDIIYDYWAKKRQRNGHITLMPQVLTDKKAISNNSGPSKITTGTNATSAGNDTQLSSNPYIAFRRRAEKMQTRKNRKNDEYSYEKMLKLKRELCRAMVLFKMIKKRESLKCNLIQIVMDTFRSRYELQDFSGECWKEIKSSIQSTTHSPTKTSQYTSLYASRHYTSPFKDQYEWGHDLKKRRISTSPLKRKRLWSGGAQPDPEISMPPTSATPASHRSRRQPAMPPLRYVLDQEGQTTASGDGLVGKKQRHHHGNVNNSSSSYYYYYMDESSNFYHDPTTPSGRSGNRRLKRLQSQQQALHKAHQNKGAERGSCPDSPPPILSRVKAIRQLKRIIDAKALANASSATSAILSSATPSCPSTLATSQPPFLHHKSSTELAMMDLDGEFTFNPLPGCRYVLPLPLKPAWELVYYNDSTTPTYSPIKTTTTATTLQPASSLQCNSTTPPPLLSRLAGQERNLMPGKPEILLWQRRILPLSIPVYSNAWSPEDPLSPSAPLTPRPGSKLIFTQPSQRLRRGRSLRTFIDQRVDLNIVQPSYDPLSAPPSNLAELENTTYSTGPCAFEFNAEVTHEVQSAELALQKPSLLKKGPSMKTDSIRLIYKNTRITPLSHAMNRIRKRLPKPNNFPLAYDESLLSPSDPIARLIKRSSSSTSAQAFASLQPNVVGPDKIYGTLVNASRISSSSYIHKLLPPLTSSNGSHIHSLLGTTNSVPAVSSFADHASYVLKQMIAPGQSDRIAAGSAQVITKSKSYEPSFLPASTTLVPPALQTNLISLINNANSFVAPPYVDASTGACYRQLTSSTTTIQPAGKMLAQSSAAASTGLQHFFILKQPRTQTQQLPPQAVGTLTFPISHGGLSSASAVSVNASSNNLPGQNYIYKTIVPGTSSMVGTTGASGATSMGGTIIRISGSDVLYNYGTNRISILPQPSGGGGSQNYFLNNHQHLLNVSNETLNPGSLKTTPSVTLRNAINSQLQSLPNNLVAATSITPLNRVIVSNPPPFPLQNLAFAPKSTNLTGPKSLKIPPAGGAEPPLDNLTFTTNTLKTLPSLVGLTGQSVPYQQNYRLLAQQPSNNVGKLQQGSSPFNSFKIMATTDVAGGGSSYIVFNNPKPHSEPGQVKYVTNFKNSDNALELVSNSTYLDGGAHPSQTTLSSAQHSQTAAAAALGAGQTLLLLSPQQHPKRLSTHNAPHGHQQSLTLSGFVNSTNRTGVGIPSTSLLGGGESTSTKTFETSTTLQALNINGLFLPSSQQNQRLKTLSLLLPNGQLIHTVGTSAGSDLAEHQVQASVPKASNSDSANQPFKNLVLASMPRDKIALNRTTSHPLTLNDNRTHPLITAQSSQISPSILNGLLEQSAKSHSSNPATSLLAYQASQPKFKLNDDAPSLNKLTNKNLLTSLIFTNNMRLNSVVSPCPPINGSTTFPKAQSVPSNSISLTLPGDSNLPRTSIGTANNNQQQQPAPSCCLPLPCVVDGGVGSGINKAPLSSVLSNPTSSSSPSFSPTIVNLFAIT